MRAPRSGFYFVPWNTSFPEKENLWVVYLEGGAWCAHSAGAGIASLIALAHAAHTRRCYNNVSCYVRQQEQLYLTSSRIWYKHEKVRGCTRVTP